MKATKKTRTMPFAKAAVLTIAEIKAAVESFDRGDVNAGAALDAIAAAVEAYRATVAPRRRAG